MLPSQFFKLDQYERAFVIAAIDIKVEKDKEEAERLKNKNR